VSETQKNGKRTGHENLISLGDRPKAELQEIGAKGGRASGVARRKQRTFRESIKAIMALQTPDEDKKRALEALGIDPTILNAINMAVSGKAAAGDVEAARYLRDTAGERPRDGLEIGNLDDKPLASLDLSKLTDEQLKVIAARRAESSEQSEP